MCFFIVPSYFSNAGEVLEPWMATWQMVQFRKRGSNRSWDEGVCEPSVSGGTILL
jgi:hypothetical protein